MQIASVALFKFNIQRVQFYNHHSIAYRARLEMNYSGVLIFLFTDFLRVNARPLQLTLELNANPQLVQIITQL
jgi:uncharacterized membrane protein